MKLKRNSLLLVFTIIICLSGCDLVSVSDIFAAKAVNSRFKEKDSLKNFTAPSIVDSNTYNFLVISDTHYDREQLYYFRSVDKIKDQYDIQFLVLNGDIVHTGKQGPFNLVMEDLKNISIPVYPVIGNHDLYNNGFDLYKTIFGRTVYDFVIGNTSFIFLDTGNGTLGDLQKNWLENKLKTLNQQKVIIFSHYSPTDREWQSPTAIPYPEEAYFLFDLCDTYNVECFFCGHLHFADEKIIRNVKYIITNNTIDDEQSAVLVKVSKKAVEYQFLSDIFE